MGMEMEMEIQFGESGEGLKAIPFNFSDSIFHQISEENERIHSLPLRMRTLRAIFTHLFTVFEVERDFGTNSIQWRKSHYRSNIYKSRQERRVEDPNRLELPIKE